MGRCAAECDRERLCVAFRYEVEFIEYLFKKCFKYTLCFNSIVNSTQKVGCTKDKCKCIIYDQLIGDQLKVRPRMGVFLNE